MLGCLAGDSVTIKHHNRNHNTAKQPERANYVSEILTKLSAYDISVKAYDKSNKMICGSSEDSDLPGYPLVWSEYSCSLKEAVGLWLPTAYPLSAMWSVSGQTAWLCRLIGVFDRFTYEPGHEKMCLMSYAKNKGADQTARLHSLINTFVVRCLDSIIFLDSIAEISRL